MNFNRSNPRSKELVIPRSHATRNLLLGFKRPNLLRLFAFARHRAQPVCSCVAQACSPWRASARVPCFRRGGVYPARRRGAPSVRFVGPPQLSPRQSNAFYPEARRAAVPRGFENSGALAPEAAMLPGRDICNVNLRGLSGSHRTNRLRQGTALAVPRGFENSGALAPEAATRWPRPRLTTSLSSRGATRRGTCFSLWLLCSTRPSSKNHPLRDTND